MKTVRIRTIRSRGNRGGAIVTGVDELSETKTYLIPETVLNEPEFIQPGQIWKFEGSASKFLLETPNGVFEENQVKVEKGEYLLPAGEALVSFISENPKIRGIGLVKARILWERFGFELQEILKNHDTNSLTEIVSPAAAESLCVEFEKSEVFSSLAWLDNLGLRKNISLKALSFYGKATRDKLIENPYRLLSFCANWETIDELALDKLGFVEDSPHRLKGAVEEVLYRTLDSGSTALTESSLLQGVERLLGSKGLAANALIQGSEDSNYCGVGGLFTTNGSYLIESKIASFIEHQIHTSKQRCFTKESTILDEINAFEKSQNLTLTDEQKNAVITSLRSSISLILGGAGTGKTTILKCVNKVIRFIDKDASVFQLSLSGKAALRLQEVTGKPAQTIAAFLKKVAEEKLGPNPWIIIDEASMVDVLSFARILRVIPAECNMILVGDQHQLPPVGPGLVFHTLVESNTIPQTALSLIKRQSKGSSIPTFAGLIKDGIWPTGYFPDITFIPCDENELTDTVVSVYERICSDSETQIISPTNSGNGGCEGINRTCQRAINPNSSDVVYLDQEHGCIRFLAGGIGFKENDPVVYTKNDYSKDLRNGSLGRVSKLLTIENEEDPVCVVEFDTGRVSLNSKDLQHLKLAYAITIHKSQGSQFDQVIIPVRNSVLLDKALFYTAITRAVKKVFIVGEPNVMRESLKKDISNMRTTCLPVFLSSIKSNTCTMF